MLKKKTVEAKQLAPKEIARKSPTFTELPEMASRAGEPTYYYDVGDAVEIGNLSGCKIDEVCDGGLYYGVSYDDGYRYETWFNIRKAGVEKKSQLTENEDIKISYSNVTIKSLLHRYYFFGINCNPSYQRGSVWTDDDRELLLETIFMGGEIGRFVLKNIDMDEWHENQNYLYEIIDGKQRLLTLAAFYEDRFRYKGYLYSELSKKDKRTFDETAIAIADLRNLSKKDTLRVFLLLNRGGKVVSNTVLDHAKELLNEME